MQASRNAPMGVEDAHQDGNDRNADQLGSADVKVVGVTGTAAQLLNAGLQRIQYENAASKLSGPHEASSVRIASEWRALIRDVFQFAKSVAYCGHRKSMKRYKF